ncbi:putative periplasmic lipoprotein [Rossellomorea aquimaris]|uniref:hypothetical protein n=1 Tax=Rossellomorea aquimaris TaxID=189382 RepID=UPI0007D0A84F|nr:hypothetical protein [Rossellomorea aquimaris]
MKKRMIALIFVFILVGCSNEKVIQPDTPSNVTQLMKYQIDNQNYSAFQSLFSEGTEDTISKETFQQIGEISTAGANFKNFELLTFDNGEMLFVEFKPKLENEDEYKIVNVKVVPEEMKELFKTK